MKKTMVNYIQRAKYDNLYTPIEAIKPLLPYLSKNKIYWECTDFGQSKITQVLRDNGYQVVSSHINDGMDFLNPTINIPFNWDILITNPPYSLKTKFLQRAYALGKPFVMLLPITTLEGKQRGQLFNQYGIQLLVLDTRINFMKTKKNVWFNTSWFGWNIFPKDIQFTQVIK